MQKGILNYKKLVNGYNNADLHRIGIRKYAKQPISIAIEHVPFQALPAIADASRTQ